MFRLLRAGSDSSSAHVITDRVAAAPHVVAAAEPAVAVAERRSIKFAVGSKVDARRGWYENASIIPEQRATMAHSESSRATNS